LRRRKRRRRRRRRRKKKEKNFYSYTSIQHNNMELLKTELSAYRICRVSRCFLLKGKNSELLQFTKIISWF
jgi:hypothetical protein